MANSKNITFDQLYSSLVTVKDEINKKADKVHGTHVAYASSFTELVPGAEGFWGSAPNVARGDHTHTLPPYPTTLPNPRALTIVLGNQIGETVYDGSQAKTLQISNYEIGAAPIYHSSSDSTYGVSSNDVYGHAKASSTSPKEAGTADVGTETSSFARGDHVHPEQVNISGNAGTATKLAQAVGITIGETSKTFDGSSGGTWTLKEIGIEFATNNEFNSDINNIFS